MSSPDPADGGGGLRGARAIVRGIVLLIAVAHLVSSLFLVLERPSAIPFDGSVPFGLMVVHVLGSVALGVSWIAPGLLWMLTRSRYSAPATLLLSAPVAFVIHALVASGVKWMFGTPVVPAAALVAQLCVEGVLAVRALRAQTGPVWTRDDGRAVLAFVAMSGAVAVLFFREIWWREFSSDGLESLDMGASLAWFHLPRTPTESGLVGLGVGMIAQAFPAYWCTAIVGMVEAAPRLPLVVFLPVVLMGVGALAERGLRARMSGLSWTAALLAVLCGAAMLGMNASFDPYHADVASPAALDAMTVAMMLAVVWAALERRMGWLLVSAAIAHFCRPSGLLLLLMLGSALGVVDRGARLARSVPVVVAVAVSLALTFLYEKVYVPRVIEGGALGLESGSLFARLRYVNFSDWQRLVIVAVASGVFPWIALARPRRLDADGRVAALVTLGMFGFFLLPASYAPHHFAPVFVLAQIPFWRRWLSEGARPRPALAASGVALAALVALVPLSDVPEPFRASAGSIRIDTKRETPLARGLLREAAVLEAVVAMPWSDADPTLRLVGSPLVLAWYAARGARDGIAFVVADEGPGSTWPHRVVERGGVGLYALAPAGEKPRALPGAPADFGRALFRVPRERLFHALMVRSKTYDVDLARFLR